jgi:hypothetical protein
LLHQIDLGVELRRHSTRKSRHEGQRVRGEGLECGFLSVVSERGGLNHIYICYISIYVIYICYIYMLYTSNVWNLNGDHYDKP